MPESQFEAITIANSEISINYFQIYAFLWIFLPILKPNSLLLSAFESENGFLLVNMAQCANNGERMRALCIAG